MSRSSKTKPATVEPYPENFEPLIVDDAADPFAESVPPTSVDVPPARQAEGSSHRRRQQLDAGDWSAPWETSNDIDWE